MCYCRSEEVSLALARHHVRVKLAAMCRLGLGMVWAAAASHVKNQFSRFHLGAPPLTSFLKHNSPSSLLSLSQSLAYPLHATHNFVTSRTLS